MAQSGALRNPIYTPTKGGAMRLGRPGTHHAPTPGSTYPRTRRLRQRSSMRCSQTLRAAALAWMTPMSLAMPVRPGTTLTELEHVLWPESVPYEELEPVQDGYRFRRRAQTRVGGVDFRHPKFFLYVQNND